MDGPVIHHDIDALHLRVGCAQILEKLHQRGERNLAGPSIDHPSRRMFERRDYAGQGIAAMAEARAWLGAPTVLLRIGRRQCGLLLNRHRIQIDDHDLSRRLAR